MPTAPTMSRPAAHQRPRRAGLAVAVVAAIATVILLFAITSSLLTGPDRVDVTIENPTAYTLDVEVRSGDGGTVHELGPIGSSSTRLFTGVIDQGDSWAFEFSYGGVPAGEVVVDRSEVEAGPVVVPDGAEAALDEADLPPPPP